MKNILLILVLFTGNQSIIAQVSTPSNVGSSTDFLGWDSSTNFDLNIENKGSGSIIISNSIANAFILVSPGSIFNGTFGISSVNTLSTHPDLDERTGIHVTTNSHSLETNYGGFFVTRANGILWSEAVRGRTNTIAGLYGYGISSKVCNVSGKGIAVYGRARGHNAFSGWFDGDVVYMGAWTPSDENLKTNVMPIVNANEIINQLSPKSYEFNHTIENSNLPQGNQFGLIAQEVAQILPQIVRSSLKPGTIDEDGEVIHSNMEFKSINYEQLIPLVLSTLQNRQEIIIQQHNMINDLEERILILENVEKE